MNKDNSEIDPQAPQDQESEFKDTVGWVLNVVLKVGAGYLAKVILDALGL